jgi:cytochrome c oxidase subunit IV
MSTHPETAAATSPAHEHEHGGTAVYTKTLIALLILTALTVIAAGFDFGQANVVIALAIATIKGLLVVLFFMHLRWDKPLNRIIAMAGFLFLGIFLMFDLIDYNARNNYLPANIRPVPGMPLAPGTAPAGEVLHTNPDAAPEGGEKK